MEAKGKLQGDGYRTLVQLGEHEVIIDEPIDKGGTDTGPDPVEMVMASLVACTAITLKMYAKTKGFTLDEVEVTVSGEQQAGTGKLIMQRTVKLIGNLDEGQRDRLLGIANRCPVHRILSQQNDIVTTLV